MGASGATTAGPAIRTATPADRPAIAELIGRVGFDDDVGDAVAAPVAADLLPANADIPGLPGRAFEPGWVIEVEGRIAGSLENRIQPYVLGPDSLVAAAASAMIIEPPLRSLSMSLIDQYVRQPGIDLLLDTTATAAAARLFTTFFRFRQPPGPSFGEVAFWITDGPAFAHYLGRRRGGWWQRLAPALTPAAMAARLLRRPPTAWRRGAEIRLAPLETLDPGFDELFAAIRTAKPDVLLARRDRAGLQWRFARTAREGRLTLLEAHRAGRLDGYLALGRYDQPRLGFCRLRVIDLVARNDDAVVLKALLAAAHDVAKRQRVAVLEVVGLPTPIRTLIGTGRPLQRRMASNPYLFRALRPGLETRLAVEAAWYPTSIDGDAC
jgi:hypothetical protein